MKNKIILMTNDDGILAEGLKVLAEKFSVENKVIIVAPDRNNSGISNALTFHRPIKLTKVENVFNPRITAITCTGTPTDCVKIALNNLLDEPPDFVFSGINKGANLGTDILYSGTVAGAMEGAIKGIKSFAFSLDTKEFINYELAADLITVLMKEDIGKMEAIKAKLFNVNIPSVVDVKEIKGIKITRQGVRKYQEIFHEIVDPRGETYYWINGKYPVDNLQVKHPCLDLETDVDAHHKKYITITPLTFDLTDNISLSYANN